MDDLAGNTPNWKARVEVKTMTQLSQLTGKLTNMFGSQKSNKFHPVSKGELEEAKRQSMKSLKLDAVS